MDEEQQDRGIGATVVACSPKLRGRDRHHLRGLGHHLKATVYVGDKGVHGGVLERIEAELDHRELVKLKLRGANVEQRCAAAEAVHAALECQIVQIIGRTMLVYRPHPEEPKIVLPK